GSRAGGGAGRRLEKLDHVPGRGLGQDLLPAPAGDDLVAEADPPGAQPGPLAADVPPGQGGPGSPPRARPGALRPPPFPPACGAGPPGGGPAWRTGAPAAPPGLAGPASSNRRLPGVTSAKAGAALERNVKPRWPV